MTPLVTLLVILHLGQVNSQVPKDVKAEDTLMGFEVNNVDKFLSR